MPSSNQFKAFGTGGGANTLTPTAYAALTTLLANGYQSGTASSQQINTTLRQSSFVAAAIAQAMADTLGVAVNDDGVIANFQAQFISAVGALATGRLLRTTVFTASGTWTAGAGTKSVEVEVIGGGGGGGGVVASGASQGMASVGGGGGGYSRKFISSPGATEAVTVGALGAAGTTAGTTGGNGGTSSFGVWCSATGGNGGTGVAAAAIGTYIGGVAGGIGAGGDLNAPGGSSQASWDSSAPTYFAQGVASNGGDSKYGSGGQSSLNAPGLAGRGYGAGGGGLSIGAAAGAQAGGAGTAGIVIVKEYA